MKKFVAVVLSMSMMLVMTACASSDYKEAKSAFKKGEYEKAIEMFTGLDDYKDSADYLKKSQEAIISETVVGTWKASIDFSEYFRIVMDASDSPDVQAALEHCSFSKDTIPMTVVFEEDGTFQVTLDESKTAKAITEVYDAFCMGMRKYVEDTINAPVRSAGTALETVLKVLKIDVDSSLEVIEGFAGDSLDDIVGYLNKAMQLLKVDSLGAAAVKLMNKSIEEFCKEIFPEDSIIAELKSISTTGTWQVNGTEIELKHDDSTSQKAVYDFETGSLSLETAERHTEIYPIILNKN